MVLRPLARSCPILGFVAIAVVATARPAAAVNTCNAAIQIAYLSGPNFGNVGDVYTVQLNLGAGSIQNGTALTVNRIRFELDCTNSSLGGLPCTDDGLVIGYQGDATITTTCGLGVSWSTGHPAGGTPNEVVFTPSSPIVIPANTPSACDLTFQIQVLGNSNDATPTSAEEQAGYEAVANDAQCNNALTSSVFVSSVLPLCVCNDNNPCTIDTCDGNTAACTFTPSTCPTTSTTTTTVATTTTTTLMHGCAPPTPEALKCEKAIANTLASLVKNLIACSTTNARHEVGTTTELSADGDPCEAAAVAKYDAAIAKIAATGMCPPAALANVDTVRDDAINSTAAELQNVYVCP